MIVVPAINCLDLECVEEKIKKIRKLGGYFAKKPAWIHIDYADSRFTFNKTWGSPEEIAPILQENNDFKFEVHVMAKEPAELAEDYFKSGVKRLIIQLETAEDLAPILKTAEKYHGEIMLSIVPETPVEKLEPYFKKICEFQILAVHPGLAGQKFLPLNLGKIKFLRKKYPKALIEVDGGVNLETARLIKKAGADIVASASYLLNNPKPKKIYKKLVGI